MVASAGASVISSFVQANAAHEAASMQQQTALTAIKAQQQEQANVQNMMSPWDVAGGWALNQLQVGTGAYQGGNFETSPLTAPFQPTEQQLEQTPGYQFTLDQGLKSTQNSYAAQGLGSSGAAMKGAASYATGLADTTYQQQFQDYLTQQQQQYSMLQNLSASGQNAAGGMASAGLASQAAQNNLLTSSAAAGAAGIIGAGNAISSGISGASSGLGNSLYNYAMGNGGLFSGGGGAAADAAALNSTAATGASASVGSSGFTALMG